MTIKYRWWMLHIVAGAIFSLALGLLAGFTYEAWFTGWTTFLIGSIGTKLLHDHINRIYTKRIEANTGTVWDVWLNNVRIGTVTDSHYASMQQYALYDWHNAIKQILNLGGMVLAFINKLLNVVPVLLFWGAVVIGAFSPESFAALVQGILNADSAELISEIQILLKVCIVITLLSTIFMVLFTGKTGFKNAYSEAVNHMLRRHLNASAEGHIHMSRKAAVPEVC